MATSDQPSGDHDRALDPAQLGPDESPATSPQDDAHDMSTVTANPGTAAGRPFAAPPAQPRQGSEFATERRAGQAGDADRHQDVGQGLGMGRAGFNGDEDRGYDENGRHGGLGSSGGREDLGERQPAPEANPFTGGYDGGGQHQPPAEQTQHLGLNTPDPKDQ